MSGKKKEFMAEAEDLLDEAREALLSIQEALPGKYDPDRLNSLFRSIHTLKGLSGLYGYDSLNALSHELEDLLDDLRLGKVNLDEGVVDFLFRGIDLLSMTVARPDEKIDIDTYMKEIKGIREGGGSGVGEDIVSSKIDERIRKVLSEYEEHRLRANLEEGCGVYTIKQVYSLEDFDNRLKEMTGKIKEKGELISTLPTSDGVPAGSIGFELVFASSETEEELSRHLGVTPSVECPPKQAQGGVTLQQERVTLKSVSSLVKVDIGKLDKILNTIGKLNLTRGALARIESEIIEEYGHSHLVFDLHRIIQGFERRLRELQDDVLEIRMVPIGQVFSRLGQVVRRTARGLGKEIELKVFGEETEIDKYVADEISDPLMHIVRNAVDHGIELPDERLSKGKDRIGRIVFRAFPRGNHVIIEIEDDGKGIDPEKVRQRAESLGLLDGTSGREDVLELIFHPGFSTKEEVSELSGRGVGLDVVKEKISGLGGLIEVQSEKGVYTRFVLTIPITLAIIRSLFVRAGGQTFAVPLTSISETFVIKRDDIQSVESNPVLTLRGEPLPAMFLSTLFGLEGKGNSVCSVIVAGSGERRVGIIVDEMLDSQDIVIKGLGDYLSSLRGFAGAAEIGRNEVVLVLDVEAVVEEITRRHQGVVSV
ncbi:MAG: chemotaxis protein CheA [Nitrospirae bacterium]|nr:MAG: chemotaxis protein CheA [Nitrospirota bacterium]